MGSLADSVLGSPSVGGRVFGDNNANNPAGGGRLAAAVLGGSTAGGTKKKRKGRSLWQQATGLPLDIVKGAAHVVANLPTEANALASVAGANWKDLPQIHPGESRQDYAARVSPLVAGTGLGLIHTAGDIIHPTHITRNPESLTRLVGDLGSVAAVAAPLVKGLGAGAAAAEVGAEGGQAARVGGLAGKLGLGPVESVLPGGEALSARALKALHTAAAVPEHGAGLPFLPVRALVDLKGKALPAFADEALGNESQPRGLAGHAGKLLGERVNPEEGGRLHQFLQRHDETARGVGELKKGTQIRQHSAAQDLQRVGQGVVDILNEHEPKSKVGRFLRGPIGSSGSTPRVAAYRLLEENLGDGIAQMRAHDPAGFGEWVKTQFKGAVPEEAAHLAADVAEGKDPHFASLVDRAREFEASAPMGKREQTARYLQRNPGSEWQLGNAPNPDLVEGATQEALGQVKKASKVSSRAEDLVAREQQKALDATLAELRRAEAKASSLEEKARGRASAEAGRARARADALRSQAAEAQARMDRITDPVVTQTPGSNEADLYRQAHLASRAIDRAARKFDIESPGTLDARRVAEVQRERFASKVAATEEEGLRRGRSEGRTRGQLETRLRVLDNLASNAEALAARTESRGLGSKLERRAEEARASVEQLRSFLEEGGKAPTPRTALAADRARQAERLADKAQAKVDAANKALGEVGKTADSLEAAPARLRPQLQLNRAVNKAAGATLPATLDRLAEGRDVFHQYHPFEQETARRVKGSSGLRARATGERILREGAEGYSREQGPQTAEAIRRNTAAEQTEFAKQVKARYGSDTAKPGHIEVDLGPGVGKTWLPEGVVRQHADAFNTAKAGPFGRTVQMANRLYKDIHFAADPATVVQRSLSVAVMTLLHAPSPIEWGKGLLEAMRYRAEHGEWAGGPEVSYAGPSMLHEPGAVAGNWSPNKVIRGFQKIEDLARTVPKVAGFFDSMVQSGYYMAKLGEGMSHEAAVEAGMRAFGDYMSLSSAERTIVRNAFPFWSFVREVTKTTAYLAEDHPLRVAMMDFLATKAPKDKDGFFGPFAHSVTIGPNSVDLTNVLADFAVPSQFLGDPKQLISGFASPPAKMAATSLPFSPLQNVDFATGKPYRRPAGFNDAAPSLLNQIGRWSPGVTAARDLLGQNDIARFKSRQPVIKAHKTVKTPTSSSQALLALLGFPADNTRRLAADASESAGRAAKSEQARAKQRARYQRDVKKAGR